MIVTVAICTLNRAESLRRTLGSLAAMRLPDGLDWEVVIVNNGGTDHTDAVIADFADRLPIRREFEPQRGLSRARNRAIDSAQGDYIVWTDDDVIVDPVWLAAYIEAFRRWPGAAVFGGPIIPRFAPPAPSWLIEGEHHLHDMLSFRDFGDADLALSIAEKRLPFGPSFAVRSAEQRIHRYKTNLGHGPNQRRRGEEIDVVERILKAGATGYWVPPARVQHCFNRNQQTVKYIWSFYVSLGETDAFQNGFPAVHGPLWFGAPRWLWRRLAEKWLHYHVHRVISPANVWLPHLKASAFVWGTIRYWRNERRRQVEERLSTEVWRL
jgi:glycosyltransferase involved in cell wall biosynthesis